MIYLDSNVWLYAIMATQENEKRMRSLTLIKRDDVIVSLQVVNEVTRVLSRKGRLSEETLRGVIRGFYSRFPILQLDEADLIRSTTLRERYKLSFWDSLHVSLALKAGATEMYSEDLHSGLVVDGRLVVVNPFN